TGRAAVHDQTRAAYRLMDELRAAHPGLEIEACASGGARVDLGVLEHTDRVWVSDCIDPLERQQMHRWTSQLIPLELMGSHIASGRSHTTGRLHTLGFRAHSALMGHLGIEWDLAAASEEELAELTAWITLYKERRELLFTGDLVRADRGESPLWLQGVVSPDQGEALFALSAVGRADTAQHPRLVLPGLDPAAAYRVRALLPSGPPSHLTPPPWLARVLEADGAVLPGAALAVAGLAAPLLDPEQGLLLSLTRESAAGASR
ncbi:MAG: alpha-galactosidase, partial [Brachybacterium paraconglomeratum]|nr:alpha-galactosidase [Brachybacterium paraconglomeratum]